MGRRLRYPEVAPEGYAALTSFGHYVNTATALHPVLLGLVYLRASVLNGCTYCTEMHKAELRKHHEPESRIEAVVNDPGSDAFLPRERAALRWTEIITRLAGEPASDEEYDAISRFFEGKDLVDLCFAIANINAWNRMGVAFQPRWHSAAAAVPQQSAVVSGLSESAPPAADQGRGAAPGKPAPVAPEPSKKNDDDEGKVGTD